MRYSFHRFVFFCAVMLSLPSISACRIQFANKKDVASVDGMAVKKGNAEIVIFYANETPQSDIIATQYERIGMALSAASGHVDSAGKATLARVANSYATDLSRFSVQVEKDAGGLEKLICRSDINGSKTGLFIFTNKLARQGKVRFCLPGDYNGRAEEVEFSPGLTAEEASDFRYNEMPLASEKSFRAMQDAVKNILMAKNIGYSDVAYVLISKSHGGGDFVVAPKLSYRSDLMNDFALKERYRVIASALTVREMRFVDLIVTVSPTQSVRLGDLMINGTRFEDIILPSVNNKDGVLKIGDLKVGDLDLADSAVSLNDLKVGDLKVGDLKIGDLKVGDLKFGDLKVGDLKVGELKVGDLKSNELKIGDLKTNDLKSGDLKNDLASDGSEPLRTPGISKAGMVQALKDFGVAMPLVFFESCDSDLGADLTIDLLQNAYRFDGASGVESLYFSDRKGLQYETVNYGGLVVGQSFSSSLKATLDQKKTKN